LVPRLGEFITQGVPGQSMQFATTLLRELHLYILYQKYSTWIRNNIILPTTEVGALRNVAMFTSVRMSCPSIHAPIPKMMHLVFMRVMLCQYGIMLCPSVTSCGVL